MSNTIYLLGTFLLASITCCAHAQQIRTGSDIPEVAKKLTGIWNEVLLSEPTCSDTRYFHKFIVSNDGSKLYLEYVTPIKTPIATTTGNSYRILYGDSNSIVLYKEGEEFEHADTGDKIIRQLIIEPNNTTYAWRIIGKPKDFRTAGGGVRCK